MLTGLRASDAATLMRLCASDQKIFLRIGNLLQANLALTEAALTELLANERGRTLLLDRRLKTCDADQFSALLDEFQLAADLVVVDNEHTEPGWRVIALSDEVDNPLLAAAAAATAPGGSATANAGATLALRVASLAPNLRTPVEGLLQASGDEQRAAALEQLRYAGPTLEVVGHLMPLLLADAADLVRERAVGLLVGAGAHVLVIDVVRALQRDDMQSLARLAPSLPTLPGQQKDLLCIALMAAVGRGKSHQVVVEAATHLAEHFANHQALDRLIELLLPCNVNLVHFVRALQTHDAERVRSILERALGTNAESDRAIIILLAGPQQQGGERLIERGVDLLLSKESEPLERMALASALRRLAGPAELATRVVDRGMALAKSYDTSVYWLLAELAGDDLVPADTTHNLAVLLRKLLREAPGNHLSAILDYQLLSVLGAEKADTQPLIEPFLETLVRYRDERTRDLVHHTVLNIGPDAIDPLWILLEDHPNGEVRMLAAYTLPVLLRTADQPTLITATQRFLTRCTHIEPGPLFDVERQTLLTAAARAATLVTDDPLPAQQVDAACQLAGDSAAEAWGWLASGPHLDPVRRSHIIDTFLQGITEEVPDTPLVSSMEDATDNMTFIIDAQLGRHTERVPIILQALRRIGHSPHVPAPVFRHMVDKLCMQWKKVSSWEIVWGPGNIRELGDTLGSIAEQGTFPINLRIRICEALLPKVSQLSVASSIANIVAQGDTEYLGDLAGRAASRLLSLISRGQFADDEQEDLADVVASFLIVPNLGDDGPLRRRLAAQLGTLKTQVSQRTKTRLIAALPTLDSGMQDRLDWLSKT